jgi:hypothetical protein
MRKTEWAANRSTTQSKVVPIRRAFPEKTASPPVITQERLRLGQELLEQERHILREAQQFKLNLDAELSAGAEIETGRLTFDRTLKVVRPVVESRPSVRLQQVSIRRS